LVLSQARRLRAHWIVVIRESLPLVTIVFLWRSGVAFRFAVFIDAASLAKA
jgi:hypothetical protein